MSERGRDKLPRTVDLNQGEGRFSGHAKSTGQVTNLGERWQIRPETSGCKRSRLQPLGEAFLVLLERDRRRLLRLCAALEKLADGLPRSCLGGRTARLLSFLNKAYDRHIFLYEKCLFPLVKSIAGPKVAIAPILAQLEYEHASDHGSVHEIKFGVS